MAKKVIALATLVTVAKELQDLCEFDPPIKTKGKTEEDLKKAIQEAAAQLGPEDELSEVAVDVFNELGIEIGTPAVAEEGEDEKEEEDDAPPVKKKAASVTTKLSSEEKIAFFSPLIESGKFTMKDLVAKSVEKFPGLSESSVRTFLVDSKNVKYNKFPRLVVADGEGKLTFAPAVAKAAVAKAAVAKAAVAKA